MSESPSLPKFRYHPNPLATGSVEASGITCICCGKATGFIYTASVYGEEELHEKLCPWCIATGRAASKYDCFFVDENPLAEAEIAEPIILEVTRKTPGYNSWQQEEWKTCCEDACEFHGDAPAAELSALHGDALQTLQRDWPISPEHWKEFIKHYVPGGTMAVYRFVCRHCGKTQYGLDPS